MKSHEEIRDRLDDYLDGLLTERERLEVTRHLDACAACAAEIEALESLLARARELPRAVDPPGDLWPGIKARVSPRGESAAIPRSHRKIRLRWAFTGAFAAAAAVAVILVGQPRDPGDVVPAGDTYVPSYVSSMVQALDYQCMGAGKELLASMKENTDPVGMEAAVAVERNVRFIDLAIAETKSALEKNPDDPKLLQELTSRYQRKLSLLQRAIRLAGEA